MASFSLEGEQRGGGGYSVELVAYDDEADPAMAVEQARKLAVDPAVVAGIGHFREGTTFAALSVYTESGIPLVVPAVPGSDLTLGEGDAYWLRPADSALAHALLSRVERDQVVALVSDGGPLSIALVEAASQQRVQFSAAVSPDTADWLERALASNAHVVICDASPVTAGEVVSALREAGWEGDFLGGPELAAADFTAVAGEAAGGSVFVTPYPFPADVPGGADFVEAYRAVSNGLTPGPLALPAYEATWVLLEALERDIAAHGKPTREGMALALPDTGREGLLGPITFDTDSDWGGGLFYWYRIDARGMAHLMGED